MAHTHEFDCKQCGAHLDSRQELDEHTREKHPAANPNDPNAPRRDAASSNQNSSRETQI